MLQTAFLSSIEIPHFPSGIIARIVLAENPLSRQQKIKNGGCETRRCKPLQIYLSLGCKPDKTVG